jgi:hypothetical protein
MDVPVRMIIIAIELTGYGTLRYVAVSLPYVAALIDGRKYRLPGDVPPPESRDLRRLRQGRIRAPRALNGTLTVPLQHSHAIRGVPAMLATKKIAGGTAAEFETRVP